MASTIQMIGEKAESFNDLDLLVLLQFVAEIVASYEEHATLRSTVLGWDERVRVYGPGVLDLALQDTLKTSAEKTAMLLVLERVRARVSAFGKAIPAAILNERNRARGVTFNNYPVELVIDAAKRLERLIADEQRS